MQNLTKNKENKLKHGASSDLLPNLLNNVSTGVFKDLTDQQDIFTQEYVANGFNKAGAAKKAYPNATYDSQRVIGSRLLTKPAIKHKVEQVKAEAALRCSISANELLSMYAKIAKRGTEQGKLQAMSMLAKYHSICTDKQELRISTDQVPTDPVERKNWLLSQLAVIEEQERAGLALPRRSRKQVKSKELCQCQDGQAVFDTDNAESVEKYGVNRIDQEQDSVKIGKAQAIAPPTAGDVENNGSPLSPACPRFR